MTRQEFGNAYNVIASIRAMIEDSANMGEDPASWAYIFRTSDDSLFVAYDEEPPFSSPPMKKVAYITFPGILEPEYDFNDIRNAILDQLIEANLVTL